MLHPANFDALKDLQDCANDLLRSPVTQQAFVHHRREKWIDDVSEGSLRMLDVCGTTRDFLFLVKQHVQDLQSALRRRNVGEPGLENRIGHFCRKKMKKEMFKCIEALKGLKNKSAHSPLSDIDQHLMVVVNVLREVRVTTISIVESILSFMSISKPKPKPKSNRVSFVSKFMRVRRIANAFEDDGPSEVEGVDTVLYVLHGHNLYENIKVVGVPTANKRLEALELAIEGLEVELECMFRRLIQTRVSLLNILNH